MTNTNPEPTPLLDASGNPGTVVANEIIESAWGNSVAGRVVNRFPNKLEMDAWSPPLGALAVTLDDNFVWFRTAAGWVATAVGNYVNFRVVGGGAGQSVPASALTAATWTTELVDPFNVVSAGVFTVPQNVPGRYTFEWAVEFGIGGSNGARLVYVDVGGGNRLSQTGEDAHEGGTRMSGSGSAILPAGAPVKVIVYHTDGSGPLAVNASTNTYFHGFYNGPF